MATAAEIRAWARTQPDLEVPERGNLPGEIRQMYADAHGEGVYAGGTSPEDFAAASDEAGDGGESQDWTEAAPAGEEERPARPGSSPAGKRGLLSIGRRGGKKPKGAKKPPRPAGTAKRLSVAGLIEQAWEQMAWAAKPLPPVSRMLYAQTPVAGVILDPVVRGTVVDRVVLQPWARREEQYRAGIALVFPPLFAAATVANAPAPVLRDGKPLIEPVRDPGTGEPVINPQTQQPVMQYVTEEPSTAYKAALIGLRWSVGIMVDATGDAVERITERAAKSKRRDRLVEEFLAFVLGYEPPPPDEEETSPADQAGEAMMRLVGVDTSSQ